MGCILLTEMALLLGLKRIFLIYSVDILLQLTKEYFKKYKLVYNVSVHTKIDLHVMRSGVFSFYAPGTPRVIQSTHVRL